MSARALNAPLLVPFNKSYVSPLISLVGALMVNTNLNLLGFLEASGRDLGSGLLPPRMSVACPTRFPFPLCPPTTGFASKAGYPPQGPIG